MSDLVLMEARETTRHVARTFALACRLLPRALRDDVYRLYLVFRTLDDLVDEDDPRAEVAVAAVEAWCRTGSTASKEARVLADLASRRPIPAGALLDFCRGMRDDLEGVPILDEDALDTYCYRVAGTVGVVMTAILGADDVEAATPRAAALGMAMQRTNILRDIDEDRENGRVYLARTTVERFGGKLDPGCRAALVRDQIARADALYEEGVEGIRHLTCGRMAIRAAAAMYREILRQIERDGYGQRAGRATVSRGRKLVVVARTARS